jgi:hypothetical protein
LQLSAGRLAYKPASGSAADDVKLDSASVPGGQIGAAVLPYQLVSTGDPCLVTTIGSDLQPSTWAFPREAGRPATEHRGCLPLLVDGASIVLLELPEDSLDLGGLRLLDSAGGLMKRFPAGELLLPAAGELSGRCLAALPGAGADAFYPYGEKPSVSAWLPAEGRELWRSELPASFDCADLQLVALTEELAVAMVQYDYEMFELFQIDGAGQALSCGRLKIQPAFTTSFPGGGFELDQVGIEAGRVWMLLAGGRERLVVDTSAGTSAVEAFNSETEDLREENSRPVGGAAIPGPGSPALPQALVTVANGSNWVIDALMRADGAVLVMTSFGPDWVRP